MLASHANSRQHFIIALALSIIAALLNVGTLSSLPPSAAPMWDEAYYLWSAQRFFDFVQRLGFFESFQQFKTGKPWLMEILLYPLLKLQVEDLRFYILPAIAASSALLGLVFLLAARLLTVDAALLFSLAVYCCRMFYFHTFSTHTEIFSCCAICLSLWSALHSSLRYRFIYLGLAGAVLLLAKQTNIAALAFIYLLTVFLSPRIITGLRDLVKSALITLVLGAPCYLNNFQAMWWHIIAVSNSNSGKMPFTEWLNGLSVALGPSTVVLFLAGCIAGATSPATSKPGWPVLLISAACAVVSALAFGIFAGHNPVKYYIPYVLFFMFFILLALPYAGRLLHLVANQRLLGHARILANISGWLACAYWMQLALINNNSNLRAGFSNANVCLNEADSFLSTNAIQLRSANSRFYVVGDNAYINYSSLSWVMERLSIPSERLQYVPPLSEVALQAEHFSALAVIRLSEGTNTVAPSDISKTSDKILGQGAFELTLSCSAPSGSVEFYRLKR